MIHSRPPSSGSSLRPGIPPPPAWCWLWHWGVSAARRQWRGLPAHRRLHWRPGLSHRRLHWRSEFSSQQWRSSWSVQAVQTWHDTDSPLLPWPPGARVTSVQVRPGGSPLLCPEHGTPFVTGNNSTSGHCDNNISVPCHRVLAAKARGTKSSDTESLNLISVAICS